MSNFRFTQTRRNFLQAILLSLVTSAQTKAASVQLQIPYADGSCLNVPNTNEIEKIMGGNWIRVLTESLG